MSIADYGFAIWETFYVTVLSTAFALVRCFEHSAVVHAKVIKGKEIEGDKYRDYFEWSEPLRRWRRHQLTIAALCFPRRMTAMDFEQRLTVLRARVALNFDAVPRQQIEGVVRGCLLYTSVRGSRICLLRLWTPS